eukprot:scpid47328/ scgid21004/ 
MARPLVAFLGGCIAVGVLHNAIALRMVLETDTTDSRGAAFDPVLNSVAHILLYLLGTFLVVCNFLSLYCVYMYSALRIHSGDCYCFLDFQVISLLGSGLLQEIHTRHLL